MRESILRTARRLWPIALSLTLPLTAAAGPAAPAPHARASAKGGWQAMVRGDSAPLLRGWIHPGLPAGWTVHDGVLSKSGPVEDLQSTRMYKDFELKLQWKIGRKGNSGIFYRATHEYHHIYWTGPEYQLLDDANTKDGKSRIRAAGAVYDVYPSPAGFVHPYGHWNSARILVRGHHVEYWMNGHRIVSYDLDSPSWKKRVAASKFHVYPGYGLASEGFVGIQGDHPGAIEIRDMRIRVLP